MSKCSNKVILMVLVVLSYFHGANADPLETFKPSKALPHFSLQDQHARPFGLAQLHGHWSLMFMGFTSCPDVCPVTMMKLEAVRAELGLRLPPERLPNIVFIAVDPQRDRPVLEGYLAYFHPENIGITGDLKQLDILVDGLDGFYRIDKPRSGDGHYDVIHTASIAVINPRGELAAKISPPFYVEPIANFLTQIIRQADPL